ncbi:MAG: glycosyl hydrolase family 28-related protein [Armatimonadota bacterium]
MQKRNCLLWGLLVLLLCLAAQVFAAPPVNDDEFVGPFRSWANAKTDYGATGDGTTDDTAALQKAVDDLGKEGAKYYVLYLPAGTYRITGTLTIKTRLGISIIGEDPARTIIRWDGEVDKAMLWLNGVAYAKFARITWDGAGKAKTAVDHGWEGKEPHAGTHCEHADEVFQNVEFGIKGGSHKFMDAEAAVLRCKFLRCSKAGVSIENFNALDWFIWYSRFEDCAIGVTNTFGAGNFNVYESLFLRSTIADLMNGNACYFAVRNNTSVNSKAFYVAGGLGTGSELTIQGNTIIEPLDAEAIRIGNLGPLLLFDNVIKSRAEVTTGPVVRMTNTWNMTADLVAVGNTFTVPNPIAVTGRHLTIDDKVVNGDTLKPVVPELPGVLPNKQRTVINLPVNANAETIQKAIDTAAKWKGQRPVIHFPPGNYNIDRTLTIPTGCDVQLVGDGQLYITRLLWTGADAGPVLKLEGPSKAIIRDMQISGGGKATAIQVTNCDQRDARVFIEQGSPEGNNGINLLADGLDHTRVDLHDFWHSGAKISIKVIGGKLLAAGKPTESRVALFSGASSNNELTYEVANGGRLLARDLWYETGNFPQFMRLTNAGTITFHGGNIALPAKEGMPSIVIDDFRGKVTLLGTQFTTINTQSNTGMVQGEGKDTQVLLMGSQAVGGKADRLMYNKSPLAEVAFLHNKSWAEGVTAPIANEGLADPGFVKDMLAQTRNERPRLLTPLKPGVTDARIYRVFIDAALIAIHLTATK